MHVFGNKTNNITKYNNYPLNMAIQIGKISEVIYESNTIILKIDNIKCELNKNDKIAILLNKNTAAAATIHIRVFITNISPAFWDNCQKKYIMSDKNYKVCKNMNILVEIPKNNDLDNNIDNNGIIWLDYCYKLK